MERVCKTALFKEELWLTVSASRSESVHLG